MLMSKAARFALVVIVTHAAITALHGTAHRVLDVELSRSQLLFIAAVILVAPLVAGVLLLKRAASSAGIILTLSMAGALVFGLYNHFVLVGPDHVFHVPGIRGSLWVRAFQATAALLALSEGAGVGAGLLLLRRNFARP
jgi:hypothetical protein